VRALAEDLDRRGIRRKPRRVSNGPPTGGGGGSGGGGPPPFQQTLAYGAGEGAAGDALDAYGARPGAGRLVRCVWPSAAARRAARPAAGLVRAAERAPV